MRGKLVCLTGIDGSGKTSLAKNMDVFLKKEGYNSTYVYARVYPLFSRFLMNLGRKILRINSKDIFVDYNEYSKSKKGIFKNPFVEEIYKLSFLLDQSLITLVKIMPPYLYGKIVICDRYIYDTIITDLSVDLNFSDEHILNLIEKMFYLLPRPDILFLVDVPEEIAYSRKNDVPHLNYLKDRRKKYLSAGQSLKAIVLDGSKSLNEVCNDAIKGLEAILSR